jgi:hypothetical protein
MVRVIRRKKKERKEYCAENRLSTLINVNEAKMPLNEYYTCGHLHGGELALVLLQLADFGLVLFETFLQLF